MTTYFVTGVNRGVGLGLVRKIASNPDNLVIGTVRNETKGKAVQDLKLSNVKLVYTDLSKTKKEIDEDLKPLKTLAPNGIDVFINNAALSEWGHFESILVHEPYKYLSEYTINVVGAVSMYQILHPHLNENAKLVFVSSVVGRNGDDFYGFSSYGASKAALNHVVRQIAAETKFISIAMHPGFVDTDMSQEAQENGFGKVLPLITADECATSIMDVVDKLTPKDTDKFFNYDGTVSAW